MCTHGCVARMCSTGGGSAAGWARPRRGAPGGGHRMARGRARGGAGHGRSAAASGEGWARPRRGAPGGGHRMARAGGRARGTRPERTSCNWGASGSKLQRGALEHRAGAGHGGFSWSSGLSGSKLQRSALGGGERGDGPRVSQAKTQGNVDFAWVLARDTRGPYVYNYRSKDTRAGPFCMVQTKG